MRRFLKLIALAGMLLPLAVVHGEETGVLSGKVYDAETGEPVPWANVVLEGTALGAATDGCGCYNIEAVPPGSYQLTASAVGYAPQTLQVDVRPDRPVVKDFRLEPTLIEIEGVEVKARSAERLLGDKPAATQLVTRERIEDKGAGNLEEALQGETGVRVASCCPTTNATEVQIQGLAGKYTEIAMDGLPGMTELGCCYGLAYIPAEEIERLEILKGPGAFQYGSDAFGGVVNVVTRTLSKTSGTLVAEGGTFGTLGFKGTVGAKFDKTDMTAILSRNRTSAVDINGDSISDHAASDRTSFSVKLRQQLASNLNFTLAGHSWTDERHGGSLERIASRSRDGRYENPNLLSWGPAASLGWQPNGSLVLVARGAYSNYRQRVFSDEEWFTAFEDVAYGDLRVVGVLPLNQRLTGLVSHRYEHLLENTYLGTKSQSSTALVLEDEVVLGPVTLVAKGRLENHTAFGLRAMPGVAVMTAPVSGLTLRASYGTGFKAPATFSKLTSFCPDQGLYEVIQNPELRPEQSQGGNLSAEYAFTRDFTVSASAFRNDISDMITESLVGRDTITRLWRYQHYNRGTVVTQGADFGAALRVLSELTFRVGYSLLDASDREAGEPLPYRPRHSANWLVAWDSERLRLDANVSGEFTGSMPTQHRNGSVLVTGTPSPAFTVWNGRVTKRFGSRYAAYVSVNNIFGFVQDEWLEEDVPLWGPNRGRYIVAGVKLSV